MTSASGGCAQPLVSGRSPGSARHPGSRTRWVRPRPTRAWGHCPRSARPWAAWPYGLSLPALGGLALEGWPCPPSLGSRPGSPPEAIPPLSGPLEGERSPRAVWAPSAVHTPPPLHTPPATSAPASARAVSRAAVNTRPARRLRRRRPARRRTRADHGAVTLPVSAGYCQPARFCPLGITRPRRVRVSATRRATAPAAARGKEPC
jgi:hypothetical protein